MDKNSLSRVVGTRVRSGFTLSAVVLTAAMSGAIKAEASELAVTVAPGNETVPGFITGNGPNSYNVPSWAILETFEGGNLTGVGAQWSFGTVTQARFGINAGNEWGGAGVTGGPPAGNYLAAYQEDYTRVALNSPANYIGFWWSGGDPGDSIRVYSKGQIVGEFNTNDPEFAALLTEDNTCRDGCVGYNNGGGYYTYVNLQAPNGVLFDEIGLKGKVDGTLESDNFVVANTTLRFGDAEEELTAVIAREEAMIEYGLHGAFSGVSTACRSFEGNTAVASANTDATEASQRSIVPTADVVADSTDEVSDFCVSVGGYGAAAGSGGDRKRYADPLCGKA
jgi:hypothetical protein